MKIKRVTTLKLSDHEVDIIKESLQTTLDISTDPGELLWDKEQYRSILKQLETRTSN